MMMTLLNGTHPIVEWIGRIVLPIPFYFMELLVGAVQAVVFTLLCAVYVMLSTSHDEHDEEHALAFLNPLPSRTMHRVDGGTQTNDKQKDKHDH